MRTQLILTITAFVGIANAQGLSYPLPMPYRAQNEAQLRDAAKNLDRFAPIEFQVVQISGGSLVIGYQSIGSGIETTNVYLYGCSPAHCTLHYFYRSSDNSLSAEIDYDLGVVRFKNEIGESVSSVYLPFLEFE